MQQIEVTLAIDPAPHTRMLVMPCAEYLSKAPLLHPIPGLFLACTDGIL